ncbi:MAG: thioesterase [Bacteroidales bacterium]|nr:thioesterase [Bacteroidales bacterium]
MESRKLAHKTVVPCYMTDRYNRLTPMSVMDFFQDVAGDHANRFGFGHFDLIPDRLVWIISRMGFVVLKTPIWQQEVEIETWHKGSEDGLFYRREFVIRDAASGDDLVRGTSGWLLLNIDDRQLVRSSPLCNRPETICSENVLEEPAPRLRIPRGVEAELAFEIEVHSGDIDRNFHTNNAKYGKWAMEALPKEEIGKEVGEFWINFNHETLEGDNLSLYRYKVAQDEYYVEGRIGDVQAFVTRIKLREGIC